ncbi:hypothetical protein OH491_09465 [Termitidicoccus mucosus]|uniref:immunoglobulin domain-containing protein n=1 Tax=Termitidicoccus mucosus TaxID=1184151 RepID=UPI003183C10D
MSKGSPTSASLAATLTIVTAPGFAANGDLPASTIAYVSDITLSVTATGTPAPSLQWQISTDSGGTWNDISGETSATLDLTGLTFSDTGKQYRVKLNNGVGGDIFSTATTLTVNTGPQPALSVSPNTAQTITGTPARSPSPSPTAEKQAPRSSGRPR